MTGGSVMSMAVISTKLTASDFFLRALSSVNTHAGDRNVRTIALVQRRYRPVNLVFQMKIELVELRLRFDGRIARPLKRHAQVFDDARRTAAHHQNAVG